MYDEEKDPDKWDNLAGKADLAPVKSELAKWFRKINQAPVKKETVVTRPDSE